MSKKKDKVENQENVEQKINNESMQETGNEVTEQKSENGKEVIVEEPVQEQNQAENFEQKYNELNDKYIRLSAEFDNFRRRSLKEKMELIKSAGEDILLNILPVVDNFERAIKAVDENQNADVAAIKEGIVLIYNNFKEFLSQRGVKEIEAEGKDFDTDHHEAISKIPAPQDEMKGKVIAVIEKGYQLHDKVIRFAKVVVGQ